MRSISPPGSESYWAEFELNEADLTFIDNLLLERGIPLTPKEMAEVIVRDRLDRERVAIEQSKRPAAQPYLPAQRYLVGQQLQFQNLANGVGTVTRVRGSSNPALPPFEVIQVELGDELREFAAGFPDHVLNSIEQAPTDMDRGLSPDAIIQRSGSRIAQEIDASLGKRPEVVRIAGKWFHRGLLAEINEGHLNLAEAVLDVAAGGPLPTQDLVKHMETSPGLDPLLTEFSVDYALQEDERFDEVGPAGKVLWFLKRLEPPEVLQPPERLVDQSTPYDRSVLGPELLTLERELDDELSAGSPPADPPAPEVILVLPFPHWSIGSLPLSARLQAMFPTAYEAPRIRFILVDGHSGAKFPGWVVRTQRYVFGLADWFRQYDVPAGGLIRVRPGREDGEVLVEAVDPRRRNDWIRTATVGDGGRIGLTMLKHPVGTAYDERRIVGVIDRRALEQAWQNTSQRTLPLDRLVPQMFRELSKLNPQTTVHAEALYAVVNVVRRIPPGPILAELVNRPYFEPVGDHYWRLNEDEWKKA